MDKKTAGSVFDIASICLLILIIFGSKSVLYGIGFIVLILIWGGAYYWIGYNKGVDDSFLKSLSKMLNIKKEKK